MAVALARPGRGSGTVRFAGDPGGVVSCETNLRTHVTGPDGRDGIFFFALEAASLPTVRGPRLPGVPHNWR
ncbi:MAG: DUF2071 domain-containing protein [Acidimicrobiia bacterium]|nr:DUF2071 domain-containing protein [Acidimicrobiia bacterium]